MCEYFLHCSFCDAANNKTCLLHDIILRLRQGDEIMTGFLAHVGCTILCPHAGSVSVVTSNTRVFVSNQPVASQGDNFIVAGCPFVVGTKPQPCITARWIIPAARIRINGQPAILQASTGLCQSAEQIPQGPPTVVSTQTRVKGM
jgi:hypothetical protein